MKILTHEEETEALFFIDYVTKVAQDSTCGWSKCGSVIVKNDSIIGEGFNSPAGNESARCGVKKSSYDLKVTDKTCCVHAEQRAIMNALKKNYDEIKGSRLYFIRLDEEGNKTKAGDPYCTICSKMALDVGVKEFVLWREEGVCVWDTKEYNDVSFNY
ncbi:hypothetical protein HQ489_04680 [Candidatus Woesearchaeota archaeon]|nr:hypothetical protein [Candidatus Woesearchaeota archaeon]